MQFVSAVRLLLISLSMCFFALSAGLHAQTQIGAVKSLLEGYEWELVPERFICAGKGVDVALREIASDETLLNYYRQRALAALRLFPNAENASYLEQVISSSASHPSQVQRALYAYAKGFAGKQPERVTEVARNALVLNTDYQTRTAAAATLATLRTSGARTALRVYMSSGLSELQRQRLESMMRKSQFAKPAGQAKRLATGSPQQFTCGQSVTSTPEVKQMPLIKKRSKRK